MDTYPVCRQNAGSNLRKHILLNTAVIGDGNSRSIVLLIKIISKPLSRLCHSVNIHAICTCANDASKPSSPKGQFRIKTILSSLFVIRHGSKLRMSTFFIVYFMLSLYHNALLIISSYCCFTSIGSTIVMSPLYWNTHPKNVRLIATPILTLKLLSS